MNYLTSYKTQLSGLEFINENEILSIAGNDCTTDSLGNTTCVFNEESWKYIFRTRDTLDNVIRYFGDIEGNEEGVIIEGKEMQPPVQFVYDPLYKHIFLTTIDAPIIRRFDLDGNLIQRIDIEGEKIDELNVNAEKQRKFYARSSKIMALTYYLLGPSIIKGHKLLVNVAGIGALLLHYDDKNIIDKKLIKFEIASEDKNLTNINALTTFQYCNNIKLLHNMGWKKSLYSK
jgi:hypothetical protein